MAERLPLISSTASSSSSSLSNSMTPLSSSSSTYIVPGSTPVSSNDLLSNTYSPRGSDHQQPQSSKLTKIKSGFPNSKQRLKYLRSSSKSLSLASLPTLPGEFNATSPGAVNTTTGTTATPTPSNSINIINNQQSQQSQQQQQQQQQNLPNTPSSSININNNQNNQGQLIGSPTPTSLLIHQQSSSVLSMGLHHHHHHHQHSNSSFTQSTLNNNNNNNTNASKYLHAVSLFRITTELINFDLPLCLECTKATISELDDEHAILESEATVYKNFLQDLTIKEKGYLEQSKTLDDEIKRLEEEEQYLRIFMEKSHQERQQIDILSQELNRRKDQMKALEQEYWEAYSELQLEAFKNKDERESVGVQIHRVNDQLENLKQTSILNDAFHLWHDGHFGTINSLRLGKLPSQPVEWNEINAAWGLAISLLDNMSKRIKFKFSTYILIPNGSSSRIEKRDDSTVSYELFGSSDISLARLFWYKRFGNGMVSFLQCLKEMCDYVKTQDPEFSVPYPIDKEHIGGMHIKMQFTNDDTWTKSLKFMLTNLKWLLIWVSKYESTQPMSINEIPSVNFEIGLIHISN
eukprot:gene3180-3979_t